MLANIRDVAIILLAVETLVIGGLMVVLLLQIWRLIKLIETEIKPLLDSANETATTVQGTTKFVSDNVVTPVVRVHSTVAGIRSGMRSFFRRRRGRKPPPPPPPSRPIM